MNLTTLSTTLTGTLICFYLAAGLSVAAAQSVSIPRSTGALEILAGPTECEGQSCYQTSIACPELAEPARAELKVGAARTEARGTIIFMTGGLGTEHFEDGGTGAEILDTVRMAGYQTVQVKWLDSWLVGARGAMEGHARLACRPATVARWIYDNLVMPDADRPLCAAGVSGGATQVSYLLSHYGLEEILDAVVPIAGPPMARIDQYCDVDSPIAASLESLGRTWVTNMMDAGFGYLPDGDPADNASYLAGVSGPCAAHDDSFLSTARDASIASGQGDYVYPNTMVSFILEEIDNTGAAAQGRIYHDLLISNESPRVEMATVLGVSHNTFGSSQAAMEQVNRTLLASCRVWEQ